MFSSSRIPLFVVSLLLASVSLVESHDFSLHQRDHANLKRLIKKRSPFPQDSGGGLLGGLAGAGNLPDLPGAGGTSVSTTTTSTSTTSGSSTTSKSTTSGSSTTSSSSSSSSTSSSTTSGVSSTTTTSGTTQSTQSTFTQAPGGGGTSTQFINGGTTTRTSTTSATESSSPQIQSNTKSAEVKSTTLTVIIAIAASVGGIAILWTIFRKWKLSSSKEFDRRLNPIDWQPTTGGADDVDPIRRRASNSSSLRSGAGNGSTRGGAGGYATSSNGHGASNPFDDFDSPAHSSAPVGGYADLSRGPSPTQMQEHGVSRGPSFNRGYDAPVPLHHQAYGQDAYNPAGARY